MSHTKISCCFKGLCSHRVTININYMSKFSEKNIDKKSFLHIERFEHNKTN